MATPAPLIPCLCSPVALSRKKFPIASWCKIYLYNDNAEPQQQAARLHHCHMGEVHMNTHTRKGIVASCNGTRSNGAAQQDQQQFSGEHLHCHFAVNGHNNRVTLKAPLHWFLRNWLKFGQCNQSAVVATKCVPEYIGITLYTLMNCREKLFDFLCSAHGLNGKNLQV